MKTILVPMDYSEIADNALKYAVELAKLSHAKIILLHAYQIPVPTTEPPVMMISPQELEKDNSIRIKKLEKELISQTSGNIKIESIVRTGFVSEEVINTAKEEKADLIVMGITGESKLEEVLMGSSAISVIKHTQTPVLVIPKDAQFKKIEKIVLAYNYNNAVNEEVMSKFKKFAKLLNAKVLVLDVEKPVAVPTYENTVGSEVLEKSLKDVEHIMFYASSDDITSEINSFADAHKCDWLAMIPHKHKLLSRLFHESNTKRMAFHTHIPLLALHD